MHENISDPYQDPQEMKGTYCLVLSCTEKFSTGIGKLRLIQFDPGGYAYIGSAMKGLKSRLTRHLADKKKLYWHIDYLLNSGSIRLDYILYKESTIKIECPTAKLVAQRFHGCPGFGSSDCGCSSHLFYFNKDKMHDLFELLAKKSFRISTPKGWA